MNQNPMDYNAPADPFDIEDFGELPELSSHRMRNRPLRASRNLAGMVTRLLPLYPPDRCPESGAFDMVNFPQMLFRPVGIWLFGVKPGTLIHTFKVGNEESLLAAAGPVPAEIFESGFTFEQLAEMLALDDQDVEDLQEAGYEGREDFIKNKLRGLPRLRYQSGKKASPFSQLNSPTAILGNSVSLYVEGSIRHAVVLGITVH